MIRKTGVLISLSILVGLLAVAIDLLNGEQQENMDPVLPNDSVRLEGLELEIQGVLEGTANLTDEEEQSGSLPMELDHTDNWCYTDQLSEQGRVVFKSELDKWRKSLGYFSKSDKAAYASYDGETLRPLGQQGDLLALNVLYDQLIASKETYASAVEILNTSVAFGSTKAAILVATDHRLQKSKKQDGQERQFTDEELITILAYYEIAARRGDVAGLREGWQFLKSLDWRLSETQAQRVRNVARDILQSLSLDHNVSKSVYSESKHTYSKAAERYRSYKFRRLASNPGITGWGANHVEPDLCSTSVD